MSCVLQRPFTDYYLPRLDLKKWFPSHAVRQKRKEIQGLLISLTKQLNPSAAAVLKLLKVDVETKEKSEVNGSDGSSVALETPG